MPQTTSLTGERVRIYTPRVWLSSALERREGACHASCSQSTLSQQNSNLNASFTKEFKIDRCTPRDMSHGCCHIKLYKMTLGNGYLGSYIDEECSEMQYFV